MVLLRDTTLEYLQEKARQVKELASQTDNVSFAVGVCLEENSQRIYDAMKTADANMYEDKKAFYDEHPVRKRR